MKGTVYFIKDERGNEVVGFWDKEVAKKVLLLMQKSKPFAYADSKLVLGKGYKYNDESK